MQLTSAILKKHFLEIRFYFELLGCDEFYIPPDGGLDLRGFSAAATFVRGVFDKVKLQDTQRFFYPHR
jgi:hypothetical protein